MWILSVISIKTFERYRYAYLREIIICRADYNKYKISEAVFKNLHPNDFEDRNIVIIQRVKDLQLGIESYQTKLNLTEPRWDTSNFLFKEDYTIVSKPRAVIYKDRNDQKKLLRENEVHNFSDGTLTRVLHKLDHMVKDFRLFQYNLGIENRICISIFTVMLRQVKWNSVLMRLIDDLLALDSIVHFAFSDRRLERTATFSISTNLE
nr:hypothetical protein [Tanacetum cinerariifolium]